MVDKEEKLVKKFWTQFVLKRVEGYENIYKGKSLPVKPSIELKVNSQGTSIGFSIHVNLKKKSTDVTLNVYEEGRGEEENIGIINYLERNSHEIQKLITNQIVWENKPGIERKVVRIKNKELRYEKESDWEEINNWCIKNSYLLKKFAEEVLLGYNG